MHAYIHPLQVPTKKHPQISELGLKKPVDMKEISFEYLRHYRTGGNFVSAVRNDKP
jgi:hypothetical protein